MARVPETYAHGRVRQRIVAVGQSNAAQIDSAVSRKSLTRDKYLAPLLQSGTIVPKHLEEAIEAYRRAPSTFVWISEVDQEVLDKADYVFLAKYGRWPVKNDDFRLNGHYHKICRSLQHDWCYYDDQLKVQQKANIKKLDSPPRDTAVGYEVATPPKKARGNLWPFVSVLVVGLLSAPILGTVICRHFDRFSAPSKLLVAFVWLTFLAVALALTLPRDKR